MISVVIPTLNDAPRLGPTLGSLTPGLMEGLIREVIFADAGSTDDTAAVAEAVGAQLRPGPAAAAALGAKGPWLLFLEPGAMLSPGWPAAVRAHAAERPEAAGWFPRGAEGGPGAALAAVWANLRARLLGPDARHGLFVSAAAFARARDRRPAADPLAAAAGALKLAPLAGAHAAARP